LRSKNKKLNSKNRYSKTEGFKLTALKSCNRKHVRNNKITHSKKRLTDPAFAGRQVLGKKTTR
jgi:hypothetical protein